MKRILLVTAALLLIAGGFGWWWTRASLPPLDGQWALPGLHRPVQVMFDAYGVPSAYARDEDDVWFAAGALHARDRLWQMELYRRVTLGRLSEVLGERTLAIDERFVTLGLRDAADAEWQRATPAVRMALERYAAGVNAVAQAQIRRQRPLELQVLGIVPAPWTPVDSLAVGRLLAWRLAENHQAELVRAALAAKLGGEAAAQLAGRYPSDAPTIVQGNDKLTPKTAVGIVGSAALADSWVSGGGDAPSSYQRRSDRWPAGLEWLSPGAKRGNSNSWVVAGRKTKGGRALLANDPHLQIEFPSIWYEMHLVAAGLDVAGVSIPGVPFIALGHNLRIAWGMTNTGADVQDLYLERIDVGRKRAMYRGEWVPVDVVSADIPILGHASPFRFEVWKTRHGTVFADTGLDWDAPPAWLSPEGRSGGEQRAYSLRWDTTGDLAASFAAVDHATDWDAFVAAVNTFAVPSQNIVYADVDGNIGYAMSGRLPVRAAGDGTRPIDGGNGEGEWTGTIDPASLPRVFNPAQGYITSSNNEVDRGFPGLITRDWAAPFRTTRIHQQLSKAEGLDLEAMATLQNDRHSLAADAVLTGLDSAIAEAKRNGADSKVLATFAALKAWDRVVDGRPVVSLYEAFEDALWRRTFHDDMDEGLFLKFYEWAGAERPSGLYSVVGDRGSRWFDDIATVDKRETRDDIFALAAADAEDRLQNAWGGEAGRGWDRVHAATFAHPLGGAWWPLGRFFNRGPVPVSGDGTTVMRVSWNRLRPFSAWEYPSWRQLFEVGQWDQSRVVLPAGQSGHPFSPNYFDQNALWRAGQYRSQPFSRAAVSAAARHRLLLVP